MRIGIRSRMLLLIVLPTLAIFVVLVGVMMVVMGRAARSRLEHHTAQLAEGYAARFDGAFRETAAIARTTARHMEASPDLADEKIFEILEENVYQTPFVYGAAMAFEPGTRAYERRLFCPYVYRGDGRVERMQIDETVYDWYDDPQWEWWQAPKREQRDVWTTPYFDEGAGNVLMVTFSAPFYVDGALRGITTVDVDLTRLRETVGKVVDEGLDWSIVTGNGQYVYSPRPEQILVESVFDEIDEAGREDLMPVMRLVTSGASGVQSVEGLEQHEREWMFYAPIQSTGWVFLARVPEKEALAPVRQSVRFAGLMLGGTLALMIGAIWFVSGRLARPIRKLDGAVDRIAAGDLEARVDVGSRRDEIGHLALSFNEMARDLRSNLDRLSEERASRQKMERDLDLAREIQRGLLPSVPPRVEGFDVAGWNQAADKTGGDYFDWLELRDGRTIVTMADVTGHGIGPALIVAVCRAYMRASASGDCDLAEVLGRVNALLCEDIPEGRFVTAAVGVIDPSTSSMIFFSAGQAPILYYEAATGKVHVWDADNLPLGIAGDMVVRDCREIRFERGDVLVLTTDGFFEWVNRSSEQYGTARLAACVRRYHEEGAEAMIQSMYDDVLAHAGGTVQMDDLTAVVIKRL